MRGSLLIPVIMLTAVLLVTPVALSWDKRQKRLQQQVATISNIKDAPIAAQVRSIRLDSARRSRLQNWVCALLQIPVGMPHAHIMAVWLVFVVAIMAGAGSSWLAHFYLSPPAAGIASLIVAGFVARSIFGWEADRYRGRLFRQIPDVIEAVVGATRAGLPVFEAFRGIARDALSPTREEFSQLVNEITLGATPAEALMALHRRTKVTEYAIFSVTLAVQSRSGGRLVETIQGLAETVRQRVAINGRAKALAAEAKLSANVLSVLPAIGGAIMSTMQPGFLHPLLFNPKGQRLLAIGIGLLVLGTLAMRKMINGVGRE